MVGVVLVGAVASVGFLPGVAGASTPTVPAPAAQSVAGPPIPAVDRSITDGQDPGVLLARAIALLTATGKVRVAATGLAGKPIPAQTTGPPLPTTLSALQAEVTADTVTASQASAAAASAAERAATALRVADQLSASATSLGDTLRRATLSLYMNGRPSAVPNVQAGDGDAVMAAVTGMQIALSPKGMLAEGKRVAADAEQAAAQAHRAQADADADATRAHHATTAAAGHVAVMKNELAMLDASSAGALQAESTSVSQQAGKDLATASSLQFPSVGAIPPPVATASVTLTWLFSELGKTYVYGATGPDTFDCSGLTQFVWNKAGVSIPRVAIDQDDYAVPVPLSDVLPGDLVFFGADVHHVGMYIGDGLMINAPHTGDVIRVTSIWWSDLVGFGRVYTPGTPIPPHTPVHTAPTTGVVPTLGAVPSQTAPPPGATPVTEPATPTTTSPPATRATTTTTSSTTIAPITPSSTTR